VIRRDHVAHLVIDRPERRNALNGAVRDAFVDELVAFDDDATVRAVCITGAGRDAFSSGMDLKEDAGEVASRPRHPLRARHRDVLDAVLQCGKPTLAVMNGAAMGAGFELALACDMRIAAAGATMALPEARRGLGATFGSVLLPRLLPRTVALEMLYTGRTMAADEAERWGLVSRTVPFEDLAREADRIMAEIVLGAPLSIARYKRMTTDGWDLPPATALRLDSGPDPYGSDDAVEGIAAFREKRPPVWSGR
jgi:enoyl-CoA hydratase